jgi:hypothetical protein
LGRFTLCFASDKNSRAEQCTELTLMDSRIAPATRKFKAKSPARGRAFAINFKKA